MSELQLIARMPEIVRLRSFLTRTLEGQGQLCFVAGAAGSGKTHLTTQFVKEALTAESSLVVATGICDSQTGAGNPYLPFREALNQLLGTIENRLDDPAVSQENQERLSRAVVVFAEVLLENGPDLVGLIVPGASLLAKVGSTFVQKSDALKSLQRRLDRTARGEEISTGVDQSHIYEQCVNVLRKLSLHQPLIVVLDDLHWADPASIGLLFRLGRRLENCRVLVLGTYRPEEISAGRDGQRHPLDKVLTELKRYHGDIWVDLDETIAQRGREFVDTLVSSEMNQLGPGFREALYRHTGGHPLFTIELLRDMQQRRDLVRNEAGAWVEAPGLDWDDLPARVEGVIEARIAHLDDSAREKLSVASVEGENFTAEVVAEVAQVAPRDLVRLLSGSLQKEHRLVESAGVQRVGRQRLSRYRFFHNVLQSYLYTNLDEIQRSYLHEDIGRTLEGLYGQEADLIAVNLAHHFELADMPEKAFHYLQRAAEHAAASFANTEAVGFLTRAFDLAPDDATRYDIYKARERAHDLLGEREAQHADLDGMERLANALGDDSRRAEAALRRSDYFWSMTRFDEGLESAAQAVMLAERAKDPLIQADGYRTWGTILRDQAKYAESKEKYEKARELARGLSSERALARVLHGLGTVAYHLGHYEEARDYYEEATELYRSLDHRRGMAMCHRSVGIVLKEQGDPVRARQLFEEALRLNREVGDRLGESRCYLSLGIIARSDGDLMASREFGEKARASFRLVGNRSFEGISLNNIGHVDWQIGAYERARGLFEEALEMLQEIGYPWAIALTQINLGLVHFDLGEHAAAAEDFASGLVIAREINWLRGQAVLQLHSAQLALDTGDAPSALPLLDQSVEICSTYGYIELEAECRALRARVRHQLSHPAAAEDLEVSVHYLADPQSLESTERPLGIFYNTYLVLEAQGDPRSTGVLLDAARLLTESGARIDDGEARRSYLEQVPLHRAILAAAAAAKGHDPSPPLDSDQQPVPH